MKSYYEAHIWGNGIEAAGRKHLKRVLALEFSAYDLGPYKHNQMYSTIDYLKDSFQSNLLCFFVFLFLLLLLLGGEAINN